MHATAKILGSPHEIQKTYFDRKMLMSFYQSDMDLAAYSRQVKDDPQMKKLGFYWRVKLILTTIKGDWLSSHVGNAMTGVNGPFRYGLLHAALQVGPVVLEWGVDSLCDPQPVSDFMAKYALIMLDVNPVPERDDSQFVTEEQIENLCRVIAKWNVYKSYGRVVDNCQMFTDECLAALETPFMTEPGSELQKFMNRLNTGPVGELVDFTHGDTKFKSHTHLDQYVERHQDTLSHSDRVLLKAYDRAYWLRFFFCRIHITLISAVSVLLTMALFIYFLSLFTFRLDASSVYDVMSKKALCSDGHGSRCRCR
jgi:hypothetical protein